MLPSSRLLEACAHSSFHSSSPLQAAHNRSLSHHHLSGLGASQALPLALIRRLSYRWRCRAASSHLSRCSCSCEGGSHHSSSSLLPVARDVRGCWRGARVTLIASRCDADRMQLLRCSCSCAGGSHHLFTISAAGGARRAQLLAVCSRDADRLTV